MIQIINLEKSFANKLILDQINFVFEEGKIYGIVGENGAGKTTLFKCISGIENYKGVITSNMGVLKDKLGFLQTESFFFPKMTGNEYLQLLCNARKIDEQEFDKKNIFNLPLQQYASTYSTGMKKKLALTGILLQKNDIYILDEPFNGVDIQSNMIITEIILALKEKGKCVLISSHIFSTLKDTCDFILILKKGRIENLNFFN
ncbi:ABC-2 type transport system ATP-binding protein [Flavobacterium sp. 9AF]|uniref:ABC transporter ATP-binding protein n=1 Tax=Flavobacterium sp. 9AF TaxID=2653142 RepID=UPI0012EF79B2|nr:ATP-binding cassette domain-containing protein [Flavobacterium sp. 9AF]VXA99660.1 ABC-2 type transport system ATP-binding protein [Flavobacterium sp. 9AF]